MATHIAEITINAAADTVFDALTKPELIQRWQFNRMLLTDWKTGSEIKFRTETEGKISEQWGTVLEVKKNELVKYNLFTPRPDLADKIENYAVTSYILTDKNGQTNVEIIQEDNRPDGFTPVSLQPILAALKNVIENKGYVVE
ncbi:MAG: ATPase [Bacteroidetes bacterium]|nr:ATPase [Bacteroidota bacterium]